VREAHCGLRERGGRAGSSGTLPGPALAAPGPAPPRAGARLFPRDRAGCPGSHGPQGRAGDPPAQHPGAGPPKGPAHRPRAPAGGGPAVSARRGRELIGPALIALGVAFPALLPHQVFGILPLVREAIALEDSGRLILAAGALVVLNTLR